MATDTPAPAPGPDEQLALVIARLDEGGYRPRRGNGDSWSAHCPAHTDAKPSLSVGPGTSQPVVVKCGAGCDTANVLAALGLSMSDILRPKATGAPVTTWAYVDEAGEVLSRVEKYEGKRFRQSRPNGDGGWVSGIAGVRRVLYRLPAVLAGVAAGDTIYIAEGEKDADRLVREGVVATTAPMGAGKWRDEYSDVLASATVVIVADADRPGYEHALEVQRSLREVDASVTIVAAAVGNDACDHFDAGLDLNGLIALSADDVHERLARLTAEPSSASDQGVRSSWVPRDLSAVLDGTLRHEPPALLSTVEGKFLIYPKKVHSLNGESESGKTWLALAACSQEINLGHTVAYVDFEDSDISIVERLRSLGVGSKAIKERFLYVRPDEAISPRDRAALIDLLNTRDATLIVFDGTTEGLGLHGLSLLANDDIATYHRKLSRPFITETNAAVLHIDHVGKDKSSRGRYAIGAAHKLAGIDVAYSLERVTGFARGQAGSSKLTVMKDRPGHVKGGAHGVVIGYMLVQVEPHDHASNLDPLTVTIFATNPAPSNAGTTTDTVIPQRIRDFLNAAGKWVSQREILKAVSGAGTAIKDALAQMVADGVVMQRKREQRGGGFEYQLALRAASTEPSTHAA